MTDLNIIFTFIKDWSVDIIAVIIGMLFVWILGFLPPKYQLHKRLNFAFKVKKAISKIDISIQTRDLIDTKKINNDLSSFFEKYSIEEIKNKDGELSFFSNETGINYKISSTYDDDIKKNFITIFCQNTFNIGFFGRIKGLNDIINEITIILDYFNNYRKDKDKITVHISITPRFKSNDRESLVVNYKHNNAETSYTISNLKIVNLGQGYLKENIKHIFYKWMTSLL